MSDTLVARRYAQALYDMAGKSGLTERIDDDVSVVGETLAQSRELTRLFASPVVSRDRKAAVLRALFKDRLHGTMLQFLEMLVAKRREGVFPQVVTAYQELRDSALGIVEANVRSAKPMTADEENGIRDALERMTGKNVRLKIEPDATLLGGVVIQVGDTVYDGSVRNQLAHLREQLTDGSYRSN